jgi:hypothetical protein
VSYEDPRTKERREKIFSPHFQEITSLEADPVAATPPRRQDNPSNVVFAPIPILDPTGMKRIVYTPALVLVCTLLNFVGWAALMFCWTFLDVPEQPRGRQIARARRPRRKTRARQLPAEALYPIQSGYR